MNFDEIVSQFGVPIAIFAGIVVVSIVFAVVSNKNNKKLVEAYLSKYPDARKVYLTKGAVSIKEPVRVHAVDEEKPALFNEKGKSGFYVKPGSAEIEISYTYTRPGVMYRNVTTTVGPVTQEITTENGKTYHLSYDKKAEEFTFVEND